MTRLAEWPDSKLRGAIRLSAGALALSAIAIIISDAPLRKAKLPASAKLEWVLDPKHAEEMVKDYGERYTPDVLRGLALDTFLFIPSYVALLAFGCLRAERRTREPWRRAARPLAWGAVLTGVLDLVENRGIYRELVDKAYELAPQVGTVARAKWTLGVICGTFALAAPLLFRDDRVQREHHGG